ncbi:nuclear transport factor 2 family protein [uncultured Ruegeria sp.]|uniref:nuclear transport factor 2 family protein n=1 Tax=uncultured Ruegeria sp. TaxID=259304 RepID=UPI002618AF5D|nr:nuclear transport factor 2 family protein [uncultured Ruegeria sp.]
MQDLMQTINNYGAAWQEKSAEKRLEFLTRCFAENGRYVDPTAEVSGREQLNAHIGEILQSTNGRVDITSSPVSHHDVVHFMWHMVAPDGAIMVAGHDFIRVDNEGKIAHLAGFFGDPAPLT